MKRFFNKPIALFLLALLVVVSGLGAARHSYTGPQNRTRTETGQACVYMLRYCTYIRERWTWNAEDSWSCSNPHEPWLAHPPINGRTCGPEYNNNYGYQQEYVVTEVTVILPPAEISAQPVCGLAGQNGWCRGGGGLQLTGHEPVNGYNISALGVVQNGEPFVVENTASALIPASEGRNDFEYWAYSTFGDTSLKGASTLYFDSQPPLLGNIEITGTSGNNGWLKSAALHASASDPGPGSGLDGLAYTLNGGSDWASLASPASLPDGVHNLLVCASDLAGNTSLSEQMDAKVDSLAPSLTISESGTGGANYYGLEGCPSDTKPVGSFAPNGYDLYDMAGNVWEWTADWYSKSYYSPSPAFNLDGPETGNFRVLRGGSWDNLPNTLRVSDRYWRNPSYRLSLNGFRCSL